MKKNILIIFILFSFNSYSQNLVVNPSFEDVSGYSQCDHAFWPLNDYGWRRNVQQSFFHSLYNDTVNQNTPFSCQFYSMPYSIVVGYQYPRTGVSCVRLVAADTLMGGGYFKSLGRSYIMGELTQPMNAGKKYCIEFYVNLANRDEYINGERFYSIELGICILTLLLINLSNNF